MSTSGAEPSAAGRTDPFADVEHRGVVALALTDDDRPGHLDLIHGGPHRLRGEAVGLVALAATHESGRGDRRSFGDPDHFEGEELFHVFSSSNRRAGRG